MQCKRISELKFGEVYYASREKYFDVSLPEGSPEVPIHTSMFEYEGKVRMCFAKVQDGRLYISISVLSYDYPCYPTPSDFVLVSGAPTNLSNIVSITSTYNYYDKLLYVVVNAVNWYDVEVSILIVVELFERDFRILRVYKKGLAHTVGFSTYNVRNKMSYFIVYGLAGFESGWYGEPYCVVSLMRSGEEIKSYALRSQILTGVTPLNSIYLDKIYVINKNLDIYKCDFVGSFPTLYCKILTSFDVLTINNILPTAMATEDSFYYLDGSGKIYTLTFTEASGEQIDLLTADKKEIKFAYMPTQAPFLQPYGVFGLFTPDIIFSRTGISSADYIVLYFIAVSSKPFKLMLLWDTYGSIENAKFSGNTLIVSSRLHKYSYGDSHESMNTIRIKTENGDIPTMWVVNWSASNVFFGYTVSII